MADLSTAPECAAEADQTDAVVCSADITDVATDGFQLRLVQGGDDDGAGSILLR